MGDCPYCDGTGVIYDSVNDLDDTEMVCEGCGGTGDANVW